LATGNTPSTGSKILALLGFQGSKKKGGKKGKNDDVITAELDLSKKSGSEKKKGDEQKKNRVLETVKPRSEKCKTPF